MKTIYLAGGCFWGIDAYFNQLKGVIETKTGYIDGNRSKPTYREVCDGTLTHAEAVKVIYDEQLIGLEYILEQFLRIVDPYSINKQGNDRGIQYRSGVYYDDEQDSKIVVEYLKKVFKDTYHQVQIKVKPNLDFELAEDYHQDYLKKNPTGYCHINLNLAKEDEKK